ncbi:SPG7 [Cordylochernes scorpioides]|uniref:SPG7 n=1 Tax=Cordylochernes scorpioides TaxID=51811 RepID=A0ABY6JYN0_9ARAC|nr:SPG7 [Cordylochernes scorpioides]
MTTTKKNVPRRTLKNNHGHKKQFDNEKNPKEDPKNNFVEKAILITMLNIVVILILMGIRNQHRPDLDTFISWNDFYHHMLSKGEVEEIILKPDLNLALIKLHKDSIYKGQPTSDQIFCLEIVNVKNFEEKLNDAEKRLGIPQEDRVKIVYERLHSATLLLFMSFVLLFLVLAYIFLNNSVFKTAAGFEALSQLKKAKFTIFDPLSSTKKGVYFKDIAGLEEAKQEMMELMVYLKHPERFRNLGARVPRGILLYGPPGCGKTYLSKAMASECGVPFLVMAGPEFMEMIGGLGAARVRDLFKEAKKKAPCIIYIDEIDAVGTDRNSFNTFNIDVGEREQTLNQLLVEMDGMERRDHILILGSTNRGHVLDKALLRPGRFDRHILIDLPTLQERIEILEYHMKKLSLKVTPDQFSRGLARITVGFSGADLANICNEAALLAASQKKRVVEETDLYQAISKILGGRERRSFGLSSEEKRIVAYHQIGHVIVSWNLEHADIIESVSLIPRTGSVFGFIQKIQPEKKINSHEELLDKMCVLFGGRAAESLIFNTCTNKSQSDLKKATDMAYDQVRKYGMSSAIGHLSFPSKEDFETFIIPYSRQTAMVIDLEVSKLIGSVYAKAEGIIKNHQDKLKLLAKELLEKEILRYADIEKLIGPPVFNNRRRSADFKWKY